MVPGRTGGHFVAARQARAAEAPTSFGSGTGALEALFLQSDRLCPRAGVLNQIRLAIDGTKYSAHLRDHEAMGYGRLDGEEARLTVEIGGMLQPGTGEDAREDIRPTSAVTS